MSEKTEEAKTLETITKERDDYRASSAASDRVLQGVRKALGIDKAEDPIEAILRLQEGTKADGPELTKPEEEGTRAFGRLVEEGRFVHVEEVSFKGDTGYGYDQVARRAVSAVDRCLKDVATDDGNIRPGTFPPFAPERALRVTVEIV